VQQRRGWHSLDARDALEDGDFGFALGERLIALRAAMLDDRNDPIHQRQRIASRSDDTPRRL
jgi:hypothetical protein